MSNPTQDPLPYAYSTGNARVRCLWQVQRQKLLHVAMETQLKALGQWEAIDGTLFCLMESNEVAYATNTDGKAQYYIGTGTSSHFINEVKALHNYAPFKSPKIISTARGGPSKPSDLEPSVCLTD